MIKSHIVISFSILHILIMWLILVIVNYLFECMINLTLKCDDLNKIKSIKHYKFIDIAILISIFVAEILIEDNLSCLFAFIIALPTMFNISARLDANRN